MEIFRQIDALVFAVFALAAVKVQHNIFMFLGKLSERPQLVGERLPAGCSFIRRDHSNDEFILLEDLQKAAEIALELIKQ